MNPKKNRLDINGEECLATCLGHRQGTGCHHRSRSTQKRDNWENWQLCHECARKLHPDFYKGKKNHGVRKVQGTTRFTEIPFNIAEMPVSD